MGLFDFFSGGAEGQLKRHSKRAMSLNAQAEDREASLQWLAQEGSEQAILGTYHGIRSVWFRGHGDLTHGVIKSNFLIQGGCVLFDEACRPLYARMFIRTAERWPIVDLVEQIRRADEASASADPT